MLFMRFGMRLEFCFSNMYVVHALIKTVRQKIVYLLSDEDVSVRHMLLFLNS